VSVSQDTRKRSLAANSSILKSFYAGNGYPEFIILALFVTLVALSCVASIEHFDNMCN